MAQQQDVVLSEATKARISAAMKESHRRRKLGLPAPPRSHGKKKK